jgi:hypothetical protein
MASESSIFSRCRAQNPFPGEELNWSMDAPNRIDWRRENGRFIHQQGEKATESNQVSMCATMMRIKNHETNLFT